MTVSEFMFLAFGLVLGVASGAALIEILRARPPARREVRVTVAQDAIPRRRATTLADDAFVATGPEPARGGPADRRTIDAPERSATVDRRTNVLLEVPAGAGAPGPLATARGGLIGVPVSGGPDPVIGALQAGQSPRRQPAVASAKEQNDRPKARGATPIDHSAATGAGRGHRVASGTATRDPGAVTGAPSGPGAVAVLDAPAPERPDPSRTYTGPCADERRLADERCEISTRAQARSDATVDALRRLQRAYDTHTSAAEVAAEAANPRTVRSEKEQAQRRFRAASRAAGSPETVEAAARAWLHEINQINRDAAGASLTAEREREAATAAGTRLEQLTLEADAARIRAEMAAAGCVAARTALADCDERGIDADSRSGATAAGVPAAVDVTAAEVLAAVDATGPAGTEALGAAIRGGGEPRIFRLLRGDTDVIETLVASLGGADPGERNRRETALTGLVAAIRSDAIERGFLRFPDEHIFWGPYSASQNRDIAQALGSLGHRFDGRDGWQDDAVPTQRELSLALGYAGLDPMRVRQWPTESQTRELFRNVDVAADEYLAGVAGELTLAEMVEMLGRRADGFVDLWNEWGRIRPLLLEAS